MFVVVTIGQLIGGIVAGARRVQGLADRARPWSCGFVLIDLRHLDGTVQELLRHAVQWERAHSGQVQRYLSEDGVDAGTRQSEILVYLAFHCQKLAPPQVVRALAEDDDEAVLEVRGWRR